MSSLTDTIPPLLGFPEQNATNTPRNAQFERILSALRAVRLHQAGLSEAEIHDQLCASLVKAEIAHRREHRFAPHCRADIWIDGFVVEVKRERPGRAALLAQISRYAAQPASRGIIVVLERSIGVPSEIQGKPVAVVSLNAAWGVAI